MSTEEEREKEEKERRNKKKKFIEDALDDAYRMIDFVAQGKVEDQTDLTYLKKLVNSTEKIEQYYKEIDKDTKNENGNADSNKKPVEDSKSKGSEDNLVNGKSSEKKEDNKDSSSNSPDSNKKPVEDNDKGSLAEFFNDIAVMSHILYPVTAESLRVMEGLSFFPFNKEGKNDKGKKQSRALLFFISLIAIIGLLVTPYVLSYTLNGAQIIEKIDNSIKQRISLSKEFKDELEKLKPGDKLESSQQERGPADSSAEKPDNKPQQDNETEKTDQPNHSFLLTLRSLLRRTCINNCAMDENVCQLSEWNNAWLGGIMLSYFDIDGDGVGKKDAGGSEKEICKNVLESDFGSEYKNIKNLDSAYDLMQKLLVSPLAKDSFKRVLEIKFTGLELMQILNNYLLLLLFGFCGTSAFVVKDTIKKIQGYTFTGIRWSTWLRILLGTFTGFFLGYIANSNDFSQLLRIDGVSSAKDISMITPLTLAFVGGYCIDLLFSIMNRFIFAITNDDRYLSVDEQLKRKTNIQSLIPFTNKGNQRGENI